MTSKLYLHLSCDKEVERNCNYTIWCDSHIKEKIFECVFPLLSLLSLTEYNNNLHDAE